ncbi:MAG: hypothetical protein P4L26_16665 [Terracidiphilus sp.]|nr:hypothetical protein [Terracidiphilus sp.]
MLDTLVGRLKWERTEDGIRVEMPGPAEFAELLAIVILAGLPFVVYGLLRIFIEPAPGWVIAVLGGVGLLLAASGVMNLVGRKRLLIMNPAALTVTTSESCARSRTELTRAVRNLRSNPRISLRGNEYPEQIQVEIDGFGGTWTIGSRLTEAEAAALISKMMEVYAFPEWRPMINAVVSKESSSLRG